MTLDYELPPGHQSLSMLSLLLLIGSQAPTLVAFCHTFVPYVQFLLDTSALGP